MLHWNLKEIVLPLKENWAISRGSTNCKKNFVVEAKSHPILAMGEVAFNGRYNEDEILIKDSFKKFLDAGPGNITCLEHLIDFLNDLELPNSLKFGIESAFVHYLAMLSEKSVHELLGLNRINSMKTFFSMPIMSPSKIKEYIEKYRPERFLGLKIKVDQDSLHDTVKESLKYFQGNIVIDANEAFTDPDKLLSSLSMFDHSRIIFIEQPLPSSAHDEYLYLKKNSKVKLFADESLTSEEITPYFVERFHGINVKLMKSGGYMKALRQLKQARELGLETMLGCMIETSLGIASAMNLAHGVKYLDLDGLFFIEKDPYNLVAEEGGKLFYSNLH